MAIVVMGIASDHGIVANRVSNSQRGLFKYLPGQLRAPGSGIRGDESGSCNNVWFRNFIEQPLCVVKIGGFTIKINQSVENVAAWSEPRSNHVGVDSGGETAAGRAAFEAELKLAGVLICSSAGIRCLPELSNGIYRIGGGASHIGDNRASEYPIFRQIQILKILKYGGKEAMCYVVRSNRRTTLAVRMAYFSSNFVFQPFKTIKLCFSPLFFFSRF